MFEAAFVSAKSWEIFAAEDGGHYSCESCDPMRHWRS